MANGPQDAARGEDGQLLLFREDGSKVADLDLTSVTVNEEATLRNRKVLGSRVGKTVKDHNGWSGKANVDVTGFDLDDLVIEDQDQYFKGEPVATKAIVKTIVMEDEKGRPLIVLMHGDKEVSTKNLARHIGAKAIKICKPEVANKHSGYVVGGTSPFGTRKTIPIYMEKTILDIPTIYVNGGRRGYQIGIGPADVVTILKPELVEVGI